MFYFSATNILMFLLGTQVLSIKSEKIERIFNNEVVDLGKTYDFLTNDNISYSFTLILLFQVRRILCNYCVNKDCIFSVYFLCNRVVPIQIRVDPVQRRFCQLRPGLFRAV